MNTTADQTTSQKSSEKDLAGGYGYMWADWLYSGHKDACMVDVYNACHKIDGCTDPTVKATKLLRLQEKVRGCNMPWLEGIEDFIDFETRYLARSQAPLEILGDDDDCRALGVLHAAYLHGAFGGLCRTPNGAEWIGKLGEFCAAAVHQGFKWLRNHGVTDWELPALGEAWCKGAAIWGLVCMYVAVDAAGGDPGNDAALERIHTVIAAHHFAGATWKHYRDDHPHKWWNGSVQGRAPSEDAIKRFGESLGWPEEMVNVLVLGAKHVNGSHFEQTRGFLIWDHTPRLKSRLVRVCDELKEAVGDMSESEVQEHRWRASSWMAKHTTHWRGRGDSYDRVQEISLLGSLADVLRESRSHLTAEFVERVVNWSRGRVDHLDMEQQELLLEKVRRSMEVLGSVQRDETGLVSCIESVWDLATWCTILGNTDGGKELPLNMRELAVRHFNSWQGKRRVTSGPDTSEGCPVCLGDALFRGLVDNRPWTGVLQCCVWGALLHHNLGLGEPVDMSL